MVHYSTSEIIQVMAQVRLDMGFDEVRVLGVYLLTQHECCCCGLVEYVISSLVQLALAMFQVGCLLWIYFKIVVM